MKYMEMVINEGLRMWPPAAGTQRHCGKDYKFISDGKEYEIQKGTNVFLNFGSFQKDPKYFPDPLTFDPYRFSEENKKNIVPGTFTPFGLVRSESKLRLSYQTHHHIFRVHECALAVGTHTWTLS
jgi:cytochrome P450 family 9